MSSRRLCECILFLCLLFLSFRHFDDADGWFHLKIGQQIFDTQSIPRSDIYSAMKAGEEWIAHEWLTQLLMFLLYRAGGFTLVTILFAFLSTLAFWIVYLRCPERPFIAAIPLIMGAGAASPMLGARPQVISILLASVFIWVQERYAVEQDRRYLWVLPGLTLLWVNAHGAFILGPILLVLQMCGVFLDRRIHNANGRSWTQLRELSVALAGCLVVVAVNPNGLQLVSFVAETVLRSTEQAYLADWASPNFHQFRFQLFAGLILGFFAVLALNKDRVPASYVLVFVTFAYLGLQSVRHVPIFAVVAVPMLVTQLSLCLRNVRVLGLGDAGDRRDFPRLNVIILAVALVLMGCRIVSFAETEKIAEAAKFPRSAVEFIQEKRLSGRIFNLYEWGGT